MYCTKCGAEIDDNSKFCKECGEQIKTKQPEIAETETVSEAEQAPENTQYEEQTETVQSANYQPQEPEIPELQTYGEPEFPEIQTSDEPEIPLEKPKKKWVGKLIACAACVAVLAAGFFAYKLIFSADKKIDYEKHPVIYKTGDGVYMRGYDKNESVMLADSIDEKTVKVSDDGKTVFFKNINDLYFIKSDDAESMLIAEGIDGDFSISADGKAVVYRKDGDLFSSNLKKVHRIARDVEYFYLSEDSKKVAFTKKDDDDLLELYICGLGTKDKPERVDKGITRFAWGFEDTPEFVTGRAFKKAKSNPYLDYHHLCYYKGDDLYYSENGKNGKKVDLSKLKSNNPPTVFTTESAAYVIDWNDEEIEMEFGDMFYDDHIDPKYDNDLANLSRKNIIEDGSETVRYKTSSLYKIENGRLKRVENGLVKGVGIRLDDTRGFVFVKAKKIKIPMSAIDGSGLMSFKDEYLFSSIFADYGKYCDLQTFTVLSDGSLLELDEIVPWACAIGITEDERYLYCVEDHEYKEEFEEGGYVGTLNRYEISKSGLKNKTEICDGINWFHVYVDSVAYNGMDLSDRCYEGSYISLNEEDELMQYQNSGERLIDDGVSSFKAKSGIVCYYVKDGELYKFDGKKSQRIDSDVDHIIY